MFTSSESTGGRGGDAKTMISPNTSFGDIINAHGVRICESEPNLTFLTLTSSQTVHCHHPGEASCQNREKVTVQIWNK